VTTFQDVQEHLTDLFGVEQELESSEIIQPETDGSVSVRVNPPSEAKTKDTDPIPAGSSDVVQPKTLVSTSPSIGPITYIGAALVLLLALVLSILFYTR
jgi:hypothetical protein